LAGGIAHDFNNILGAILGFTELAQRRLDDRTRLEHYLQQLHVAGQRARELVRQILTFARKTDDEPSLVKVAPIFKEVGKLMRATLPTTIEIRTTVRAEADILGSPIELHQLMVNLCTNAAHAMEEPGGVMSLELDYLVAGSDELPRKLATRNENFLCLVVSDTGTGIPSHVRDRIFDPYFTTKEQGKGSGLGLAVVRGIVERLGGEIGVKSAVGRGTRMAVFLPVAEHGDAELGGKDIPAELPRGDEPVLLVDDEAALLEFGAEALRTLGYEVTPCARAEEALARVEQDPKKYRAVVSDVTMPGITGDRLASQLLEINPELRVLLCTGYTDRLAANDAQRIGVHAVLNKPLTVEELAVKVREALDQPAIASSTAKPSEH